MFALSGNLLRKQLPKPLRRGGDRLDSSAGLPQLLDGFVLRRELVQLHARPPTADRDKQHEAKQPAQAIAQPAATASWQSSVGSPAIVRVGHATPRQSHGRCLRTMLLNTAAVPVTSTRSERSKKSRTRRADSPFARHEHFYPLTPSKASASNPTHPHHIVAFRKRKRFVEYLHKKRPHGSTNADGRNHHELGQGRRLSQSYAYLRQALAFSTAVHIGKLAAFCQAPPLLVGVRLCRLSGLCWNALRHFRYCRFITDV
jgi:hypothetical protein